MSKIVRNNEPKEKASKTHTLLIYSEFVKSSTNLEKSLNKLINICKSTN